MYTIKHDNRTLFDPSVDGYFVEAPLLSLEANKLASLEFTIYPDNPEFTRIGIGTSVLSVYRDGMLLMRLRPMYKKITFAGGVTYKCEEQSAMLDDVLHRPDYFEGTVQAYIQRMVSKYNALVDSARTVNLGNVLFNATTEGTFINDDYEGFWEGLVSHLVDVYGGYLLPRYTASGLYIDYVTDGDLPVCGQIIGFGENMADLFLETETSETYTVLIPLGPNVDVENPEEGQAKQRPMTIASVNSGKDYLENAAGIAVYGRREKIQQWQDAEDANDLKTKGQAFLAEHAAQLKKTITLSAVDLHYLNVDTAAIAWMTRIPIVSEPHGINTQYTATKLDLNLGNPEPVQLQMGEPSEVFTDRVPKNSVANRRSRAGGRGGGRAASSSDVEHWEMVVHKDNDVLWNSGIKEIYESGIILDAQSGVRLYNLKDILVGNNQVVGLKGYIDVNASHIDTVVEKTGIDSLGVGETLTGKISVNADNITAEVTRATAAEGTLSGRITVAAGKITQIVEAVGDDGEVTAASIVASINGSGSSVLISANVIDIDGVVTALESKNISCGGLHVEGQSDFLRNAYFEAGLSSDENIVCPGVTIDRQTATWQSATVVTGVSITDATVNLSTQHSFIYGSATSPQAAEIGHLVTSRTNGSHSVTTDTLYYLGSATAPTPPAP